ncbi:MAG: trypsin-like peptidase domain-containing protein [Candidatus Bipolaricaulia bacterium]
MNDQLTASIVRILAANGAIAGTGFLVAERQVLTCAHVVSQALGLSNDTSETLQAEVRLDFPLLVEPSRVLTARVILWQPPRSDSEGDIAGLELDGDPPVGAQPVRLVKADDLWEHSFRTFGFPTGHDDGVWTSGLMRGRQTAGWVQIEDVKETGYRVEPGFSGAPVWDEQLDGVAGMAVAAEGRPEVKAAFIIPTDMLVDAWPTLDKRTIPPCPYRGLFAFREQDAPFFFGREVFTERLVEAVQKKPLAAVIGPSGSGKSSVVFAGLLPRLHHEGSWLIASFHPGSRPFHALAATLLPLLEPEMSETDRLVETRKLAEVLSQRDLGMHEVVERILQKSPDASRLLLVADQFEELYTLCPEPEIRRRFLDGLLEAAEVQRDRREPILMLTLTLRADFFGHALSYRPFTDALQNADLKLGPMTRQELQDAIEKPAHQLGMKIDDGLTDHILNAIGEEPGNLPLLEFALTRLWERQRDGKLTHATYKKIGGVEKALAGYAEEEYDRLNQEEQERAQRVFIQLVRPGEGTEDTRRLATRAEVGEDNWDLVTRLADARLVVTGRDEATGEKTVEIVHETLIREWKSLREWMNADRAFRTWQERLRAALRQWETSGRDEGALLRGVSLVEAEGWLTERETHLSQAEQEYIKVSLTLRERDRTARERLRRRVTLGLAAGLIITVTLALLAGIQWRRADEQRRVALSRQLAAQARNQLNEQQLDLALLLSVEAVRASDTVEARNILLTGLEYRPHLTTFLHGHISDVTSVAFSPNGKMLASASCGGFNIIGRTRRCIQGEIRLWDVETRQSLGLPLTGHTDATTSVAFSPDGQMLASTSRDNTIILWDVETRQPLGQPRTGHTRAVNSVAFSPDGKTLASAGGDGILILWDIETRQPLDPSFTGHTDAVNSVAFSPDGKTLASAGCGKVETIGISILGFCTQGEIRLWDVETRQLIDSPLTGHTDAVNSVTFGPDGKTLASASADHTLILWDLETHQPISQPLTGHTDWVNSVTFSPDGKMLTSASGDDTLILWDVETLQPLGQPLIGHTNWVNSVVFSPDGKTLASASTDNTLILWDVDLESWQAHACGIANRNLTRAEWEQYMGDKPYRKTCADLPRPEV